jgi:hypothetical protein
MPTSVDLHVKGQSSEIFLPFFDAPAALRAVTETSSFLLLLLALLLLRGCRQGGLLSLSSPPPRPASGGNPVICSCGWGSVPLLSLLRAEISCELLLPGREDGFDQRVAYFPALPRPGSWRGSCKLLLRLGCCSAPPPPPRENLVTCFLHQCRSEAIARVRCHLSPPPPPHGFWREPCDLLLGVRWRPTPHPLPPGNLVTCCLHLCCSKAVAGVGWHPTPLGRVASNPLPPSRGNLV